MYIMAHNNLLEYSTADYIPNKGYYQYDSYTYTVYIITDTM